MDVMLRYSSVSALDLVLVRGEGVAVTNRGFKAIIVLGASDVLNYLTLKSNKLLGIINNIVSIVK